MSRLFAIATSLGVGILGIFAAGAIASFAPGARAQTAITGSPIPSPVPVNPTTGHGLRNSRPATSVRGRQIVVPRYPVYSGRSSKAPVRNATPRARVVRDGIGQPFVIIDSNRVRVIQDRFGNDVFILDTGRGRVVNIP